MQSTISIFRYFYQNIPSFAPEELVGKMEDSLVKIGTDNAITVEAIEDVMIRFGYELWPYNQAYKEMLLEAEIGMGDHFLLPKLSDELQEKYLSLKEKGMTINDLHSGGPAEYFSSEERVELQVGLHETKKALRKFLTHEILSLKKDQYLEKVKQFEKILKKITGHMNDLRKMAEKEHHHPMLAKEILGKVRSFEFGLCFLGPEINHEEVENSVEFYQGRQLDLGRMRGINEPAEVDFYGAE